MIITAERLDVTKLIYLNFNTSDPGIHEKACESAYSLWKNQWIETFSDLDKTRHLTSDDFIDHELCGLFDGDKAVGFMLCKFMDLRLKSTFDILYFKNYPKSLIERNKTLQDTIMIMSFMTLNPAWRKSFTNFSISELLIGFMVLRLNVSNSKRAIGYFRNNRSTNEIFYRHSGRFLLQDKAYNVEVDYAETDPQTSTLSSFSSHALLNFKLWNEFYYNQRRKTYELERGPAPRQSEQTGRRIPEPTLDQ